MATLLGGLFDTYVGTIRVLLSPLGKEKIERNEKMEACELGFQSRGTRMLF